MYFTEVNLHIIVVSWNIYSTSKYITHTNRSPVIITILNLIWMSVYDWLQKLYDSEQSDHFRQGLQGAPYCCVTVSGNCGVA